MQVGTLKEIGARAGDWVQFEDKQPYQAPLTRHEIETDTRTGFRIVKRAELTTDDLINNLVDFIDRSGVNQNTEWPAIRDRLVLRLHERDRFKMACEKDGKVVVDVADAMGKVTPEMIAAMAPLLTNPLIAMLEKGVSSLQQQLADETAKLLEAKQHAVTEYSRGWREAWDQREPEIAALQQQLADQTASLEIMENHAAASHARGWSAACESQGHALTILKQSMDQEHEEALSKQQALNAAHRREMDAELDLERQYHANTERLWMHDRELLAVSQTSVTALQDALNRVRIAIGMEPGIAGAPGDIAAETEKRFAAGPEDFWAVYDGQTGQWCITREPPKVVRSFDDEVLHLRTVPLAPAAPDAKALNEARKAGWKTCLSFLTQGGSQTSTDMYNASGTYLGRFHGFFPAGATLNDRYRHYQMMADFEIATKHAKPLDFGDLSLKQTSETGKTAKSYEEHLIENGY